MQTYSLAIVPGVIDGHGFQRDSTWYPPFWQLERYLASEQVKALNLLRPRSGVQGLQRRAVVP